MLCLYENNKLLINLDSLYHCSFCYVSTWLSRSQWIVDDLPLLRVGWASLVAQMVKKKPTCNAGDPGLIPGSRRSPGEGIDYSLQYSGASLVAQLVKNLPAVRETWVWSLDQEDPPGEGNGNPLQCSCLENSMDRGAWWATVHRAAKSWTWLSDSDFTSLCFSSSPDRTGRQAHRTAGSKRSLCKKGSLQTRSRGELLCLQVLQECEFTVSCLDSLSMWICPAGGARYRHSFFWSRCVPWTLSVSRPRFLVAGLHKQTIYGINLHSLVALSPLPP